MEQIQAEQCISVICLKLSTGNYWTIRDTMSGGWTTSTHSDPFCDFTCERDEVEYKSYPASYKMTYPKDTTGKTGWFSQITKTITSDVNSGGLRVWFNGRAEKIGIWYIQLSLYLDGEWEVKAERDLYYGRNTWNNILEYIGDELDGNTPVRVKVVIKENNADTGFNDLIVYVDDIEEYMPYENEGGFFFTNFDQPFKYWDVSNYTQGTFTEVQMESFKCTYEAIPFQVAYMTTGLNKEIEGITVILPLGNPAVVGAVMDIDEIRGQEVTVIETFWDCREDNPTGGDHDCFKIDTYEIDSITSDEGKGVLTFSLKGAFAVDKIVIPSEPYDRDFCRHIYRSTVDSTTVGCGYIGEISDCDKTLNGINGCVEHENSLNFGAQPGIPSGRVQIG